MNLQGIQSDAARPLREEHGRASHLSRPADVMPVCERHKQVTTGGVMEVQFPSPI